MWRLTGSIVLRTYLGQLSLWAAAGLPERLASFAARTGCGASHSNSTAGVPSNATNATVEDVLTCSFGELHPPEGSREWLVAEFSQNGILPDVNSSQDVTSSAEPTLMGASALLAALSGLGEALQPDDIFADLGAGSGRLSLFAHLTTPVGKVVGVEPRHDLHLLAAAAGRTVAGAGPTLYAVGVDQQIYARELQSQPQAEWMLVGNGSVTGIAIQGNVIYGVGGNGAVYSQSLSTMSLTSTWKMASTTGVQAIAVHGKTIYAIGEDNRLWSQPVDVMTVNTTWMPASLGAVISAAIEGDTVYAVGTDLGLWKQTLSNMTPESPWSPAARGSVERVAIHHGHIYAVGWDKRLWSQPLSTMSMATSWVPAAKGAVLDVAVSPYSFHPAGRGMGVAAPLHFLHGQPLEHVAAWGNASVIYLPSSFFSDEQMTQLAWAMSATLRPGTVTLSHRAFPGCWPGLKLVQTLELALWGHGGSHSRVFVYMVTPPPVMPQPAWMVSHAPLIQPVEALLGPEATKAQWLEFAAGAWPQSSEAMLVRLLVLSGNSDSSSATFPVGSLEAISQAGLPEQPVLCAWEALLAVALASQEPATFDNTVTRISDAAMADKSGRTLAWVAAAAPEEDLAIRLLPRLVGRAAPIDTPDNAGIGRPLEMAVWRGHVDSARLLLRHKVAITGADTSPLHLAALHGHAGVAQLLLEQRADPNVRDGKGHAAWELAPKNDRVLQRLLGTPGLEEDVAETA